MKALIVVDMQNDFCPGGALAVGEGDKIVSTINDLLNSSNYQVKVATLDSHPETHKSFALNNPGAKVGEMGVLNGAPQVMWPAHCVKNTKGEEFHPEINQSQIHAAFKKGENPEVDSYSGFFDNDKTSSTGLEKYLKEQGVTDVDVVGLALDYCVKATAMDAKALGFKTRVILSGTKAVNLNPHDGNQAIKELISAGIEVVD